MAAVLTATAPMAAVAEPTYRIEAMEKSNGIFPRWASSISDAGHIAGYGRDRHSSANVLFLKKAGEKAEVLPGSNYSPGYILRVNDAGDVMGTYLRDEGNTSSVQQGLWSHDGSFTDLEQLAGCDSALTSGYTSGGALNPAGDVAFWVRCKVDGLAVNNAVLSQSGSLIALAGMGGLQTSVGGANAKGQFTGRARLLQGGGLHAVVWEADGSARDLGTLGGASSRGSAINDLGHVVGVADLPGRESRPFVHDGTTMKELPMCDRKHTVGPIGITNDELIVGVYGNKDHYHTGLIQNGVCQLLDTLLDASGAGWTYLHAHAVNNAGVIVGSGFYQGDERAFIASPLSSR